MRIVDVRERSVAISRYRDTGIPSGGLTTSIVAVVTDARRDGRPVVGWGFGSMGRFAQGGLPPFGGLGDGVAPAKGRAAPPEAPGTGFETKADLARLLRTLLDD